MEQITDSEISVIRWYCIVIRAQMQANVRANWKRVIARAWALAKCRWRYNSTGNALNYLSSDSRQQRMATFWDHVHNGPTWKKHRKLKQEREMQIYQKGTDCRLVDRPRMKPLLQIASIHRFVKIIESRRSRHMMIMSEKTDKMKNPWTTLIVRDVSPRSRQQIQLAIEKIMLED